MKTKPSLTEKAPPSLQDRRGKLLLRILQAVFVALSVAAMVYQYVQGDMELVLRGFLFIPFLFIPPIFRKLGLKDCWRMYTMAYLFSIFAFCYGCMFTAFRRGFVMDKISHFLSGFVFTIVGICLYYYMAGAPKPGLESRTHWLAASYGLFLSMFIAAFWEVVEFFDFVIAGNDSQNHLTTGVFDTMYDIMACLAASLLSAAAYMLWRKKGVKLFTAWVVEEFYEKNVLAKAEKEAKENSN